KDQVALPKLSGLNLGIVESGHLLLSSDGAKSGDISDFFEQVQVGLDLFGVSILLEISDPSHGEVNFHWYHRLRVIG
ncbi:hypothetical protein PJP07_31200, partial [Mycobacterium kansasii]